MVGLSGTALADEMIGPITRANPFPDATLCASPPSEFHPYAFSPIQRFPEFRGCGRPTDSQLARRLAARYSTIEIGMQ